MLNASSVSKVSFILDKIVFEKWPLIQKETISSLLQILNNLSDIKTLTFEDVRNVISVLDYHGVELEHRTMLKEW